MKAIVKVVGIGPPPDASTDTYYVEVNGTRYVLESYADRHTSDISFYDENGSPAYPFADLITAAVDAGDMDEVGELEEWTHHEDPRVNTYWSRYQAEIAPLVEKLEKEVFVDETDEDGNRSDDAMSDDIGPFCAECGHGAMHSIHQTAAHDDAHPYQAGD